MPAESVELLCQKAREAVEQRNPEKARQLYRQALGLRGDSPDVHYGLATACFLLNDLDSAAYHFKEVTRLDPLRPGAYINLGAVYNRFRLGDPAALGIVASPMRESRDKSKPVEKIKQKQAEAAPPEPASVGFPPL